MSGYILCQVKRAELPYYIENISTNIYSIEELCFYFHNNIYLLDSTILNEELCFWIRDQLGLRRLAQRMYELLDKEATIGDFILPVFKEINYLSMEEFRRLNARIQQLETEPEVLRQKRKGDYLIEHQKYVNAIKIYKKALLEKSVQKQRQTGEKDQLGVQFIGGIWHNMGCAYARLFQMEEAIHCFEQAYEHLRTMESIKSYLYAICLEEGEEAFEQKAAEIGLESAQTENIRQEIEEASRELYTTQDGAAYAEALELKNSGDEEGYRERMRQLLDRMTGEYHRSTGY